MANHSVSKGGELVTVVMVTLVLLTSSLAVTDGMRVTLENDMTQALSISCQSTKGDIGARLVSPGLQYIIDIPGRFTSGLKYTCTFVAPGKPTTTIDVFVGWGGVKNAPCNCLGDSCPWQITASGFSCNSGTYSRTWG
jgi:hypothetical protein